MPDINWGGDATSAPFKSRLDETDGNLVIAEDTNGETRLLEWDGTAWQVRGPVELNGEDVSGVGTLSATDLNADSVNTEQASINGPLDAESATVERIVNDYFFAGSFDGSTADERLDNALSVVKDGSTIYLETADYETNRTINNKIIFVGTGGGTRASNIGENTTWTLADTITLVNISGSSGSELIIDDIVCSYSDALAGSLTIQVNSDRFRATNIDDGEIIFASGTSDGIVDASTRTDVTDNGTNTVGDIA